MWGGTGGSGAFDQGTGISSHPTGAAGYLEKFLTAVRRGRERLHERSQETVVAGVAAGSDNEHHE